MIGIEPDRYVTALSVTVWKIYNLATDEPMKTVLHPLTRVIADISNAAADDKFADQAIIDRIDQLITERSGKLIDTAGRR